MHPSLVATHAILDCFAPVRPCGRVVRHIATVIPSTIPVHIVNTAASDDCYISTLISTLCVLSGLTFAWPLCLRRSKRSARWTIYAKYFRIMRIYLHGRPKTRLSMRASSLGQAHMHGNPPLLLSCILRLDSWRALLSANRVRHHLFRMGICFSSITPSAFCLQRKRMSAIIKIPAKTLRIWCSPSKLFSNIFESRRALMVGTNHVGASPVCSRT